MLKDSLVLGNGEFVNIAIFEKIAVVTLDRPPVNAMNREIRREFIKKMALLQENADVNVIVLTGAGKIFSAGADIKEKNSGDKSDEELEVDEGIVRDSFFAILDSAKPVIAAVNGGALGAGFVMAACCDFIVSSPNAFFAMPEIDVGLGGGASFLRRILPPPVVRRLVLTAERVTAQEMHRLGALEVSLTHEELLAKALEIAKVIATKIPRATLEIKESFSYVWKSDLKECFMLEQKYSRILIRSKDAANARNAFLERKKNQKGKETQTRIEE